MIDTGLATAVGFAFSANTGRLLENLVFLALRRQTPTIHYYRSPAEYEVDFYLPTTRQLIQVTQSLAAQPCGSGRCAIDRSHAHPGAGTWADPDRCQRRAN